MYGSSFVPRVSITKAWDNLHFKALLSSAFRSPSIQNMDLNTNLQAETSTIAEIEAGYCFSESMDIVISGYDMLTKKPIVYYYDEAEDEDEYINGSRSGTRGLEVECRHKTRTLSFAGNYSFYITEAKNVEANYEVPQNHDVVLAFPAHKVSAWASYVLSNKLSIYGSFVFKGPRYGIVTYDKETENTLYKKFRPTYTINIMTNFRNILSQHLTFSAGIKNLFNANDAIIQPYNNLHAPMPGASRQFVVKAAYNIPFKH